MTKANEWNALPKIQRMKDIGQADVGRCQSLKTVFFDRCQSIGFLPIGLIQRTTAEAKFTQPFFCFGRILYPAPYRGSGSRLKHMLKVARASVNLPRTFQPPLECKVSHDFSAIYPLISKKISFPKNTLVRRALLQSARLLYTVISPQILSEPSTRNIFYGAAIEFCRRSFGVPVLSALILSLLVLRFSSICE